MLFFTILIISICFSFSFCEDLDHPFVRFADPCPENYHFELSETKNLTFKVFKIGLETNVLLDVIKNGKLLEELFPAATRESENGDWEYITYTNLNIKPEDNGSFWDFEANSGGLTAFKNLTIYLYEKKADFPPKKDRKVSKYGEVVDCDTEDKENESNIMGKDYSARIVVTTLACITILVMVSAMTSYGIYVWVILPRKRLLKPKPLKLSKEIKDKFIYGERSEQDNYTEVNANRIETRYTKEPYLSEFEVSKKRLKLGKKIGKGNFGVVYQATLCSTRGKVVDVACKTVIMPEAAVLKNEDEKSKFERNFDYFLREIKILQNIGHHDNVVGYIGSVTKNIEFFEAFLIVELCLEENLGLFLQNNQSKIRSNFRENIKPLVGYSLLIYECDSSNPSDSNVNITDEEEMYTEDDLLRWAIDIASGMEYLSNKWFIHCDLAARNILLSYKDGKLIAKIMDFGLSKHLAGTEECDTDGLYYTLCKKTALVPVLWMAPEVINYGKIYVSSDVWSFGITLWEIFSLGETPYLIDEKSKDPGVLLNRLEQGERLDKPSYATEDVYNVMKECWQIVQKERPRFDYLKMCLMSILKEQESSNF